MQSTSAAMRLQRKQVLPPRSGRRRGPAKKVPLNFRCEPELAEWVEGQAKSTGRRTTDILENALKFERDFADVMGSAVWEIFQRAETEKTAPGAVVARLVLQALKK